MAQDRAPVDSRETGGTYFLGRYRVVDEIGIGGMASVHLARMDGPGGFQKWVAIKKIHPHLVEDESFVQMFLDEARIAARISHPNVATVFDLGKHEDTFWIAMEYLHGEPLREVMRRTEELGTAMPPEIACRVIADAAEGLHAAHELLGKNGEQLGLVHRDVTPHNLFVTYDGVTKVVDFGIAKFASRASHTRAGTLKGKLAYMSPEQLVGSPIDRRSDVFALGVVLYEISTGQKPFLGEHDPQVMAAIVMGNFQPPHVVRPGYPAELEAIVMRALASEPTDRFASAQDMQRALEAWLGTSGPPVLQGHVALLVRERCGDEVAARARALHEAMRGTHGASPTDTAGGGVELERQAGASGRNLVAIAAAALVGVLLGLGVVGYVWSTKRKTTVATPVSASAPVVSVTTEPPRFASASASASAPRPAPSAIGLGRVHVKVDPPTSLLIVEGVVLPRGVDHVARPEDGGTVQIVVRADGHEDTILVVDLETPDEVEVALLPITPQHRPRPRVIRERGDGGAVRAAATASAPSSSSAVPEAPPNPYE